LFCLLQLSLKLLLLIVEILDLLLVLAENRRVLLQSRSDVLRGGGQICRRFMQLLHLTERVARGAATPGPSQLLRMPQEAVHLLRKGVARILIGAARQGNPAWIGGLEEAVHLLDSHAAC